MLAHWSDLLGLRKSDPNKRVFNMIRHFALLTALAFAQAASAAPCGNDAAGFETWKQQFASEAAAAGVGQRGLQALAGTQYAQRTINADRNQRSFRYELSEFMRLRGADTIVAQGKRRIARNPAFYASLEAAYGVPASVVVAIHGMETGFGNFMGDANVLSAISTLAYDCRRTEFFTGHAMAALELVDRGSLSPNTVGAMHGEVGHTQFLPGNVLRFGVDGDGNGVVDLTNITDSLASTANFLRQKGWQPGQGFQEGQPNFRVIQEWNAAGVYQQAIAIMAGQIDS
jgi:lytic murein transglycosylase